MSKRERQQREARLAQLNRRQTLSAAEQVEHDRLSAWRDGLWKRLPARIERLRADLADWEGYANEIGLGPC
ncbi:hypothetical protein [Sphingomonas sp. CROZ-RG-20F-R02-07]|uniref:hypothetical protein n=1 Tax=Sphingomonas sp. CROZ-RG-20F-R02-07 TaxID=2914832 RepID=UPI001F56827C|nr:hypothetical protein [Sphingomonas sp. CROZ-RG-20F-R02-07]